MPSARTTNPSQNSPANERDRELEREYEHERTRECEKDWDRNRRYGYGDRPCTAARTPRSLRSIKGLVERCSRRYGTAGVTAQHRPAERRHVASHCWLSWTSPRLSRMSTSRSPTRGSTTGSSTLEESTSTRPTNCVAQRSTARRSCCRVRATDTRPQSLQTRHPCCFQPSSISVPGSSCSCRSIPVRRTKSRMYKL